MGIYFRLEERVDNLPLEEMKHKNDKTGEEWISYYQPKVKFESARTVKSLYRIMSKFIYTPGLKSHDIDVEIGWGALHPGYHRPVNIEEWIEIAVRLLPENEREIAVNTLCEFKKNPKLYYFISY